MMNESDAKHAMELYAAIRRIDGQILQFQSAHTIKVEATADIFSGDDGAVLELAEGACAVRDVAIGELRRLRVLRGEGLARLGFAMPETKA